MILSDFHTHTCFSDGKNTAEEMVRAAIAHGYRTIGFSEHAFCPLDPECSLSPEGTLAYRAEIARLRMCYQDQIEVLCGIEMDADSEDDPSAYDYVIGSVHYLVAGGKTYSVDLSPEETATCVAQAFGGDYDAYAEAYFEKVARFCASSSVQIVGHFDLITKFKESGACPDESSPRYRAAWRMAMHALSGKALEVNSGAVARGYRQTPYPSDEILRAWHTYGGKILLSSDAHSAATLHSGFEMLYPHLASLGFQSFGFTDAKGCFHTQA